MNDELNRALAFITLTVFIELKENAILDFSSCGMTLKISLSFVNHKITQTTNWCSFQHTISRQLQQQNNFMFNNFVVTPRELPGIYNYKL